MRLPWFSGAEALDASPVAEETKSESASEVRETCLHEVLQARGDRKGAFYSPLLHVLLSASRLVSAILLPPDGLLLFVFV